MTNDLYLTENNVLGQMVSEGPIKYGKHFHVIYVAEIIVICRCQLTFAGDLRRRLLSTLTVVFVPNSTEISLRKSVRALHWPENAVGWPNICLASKG